MVPLAWKNFGCTLSSPTTDPDGVGVCGGREIASPEAYKKVELEVFDWRGGLAGCVTVFASLAKKNFESTGTF